MRHLGQFASSKEIEQFYFSHILVVEELRRVSIIKTINKIINKIIMFVFYIDFISSTFLQLHFLLLFIF